MIDRDLNTAGGRLSDSIEYFTGLTFGEYAKKCKVKSQRMLYNYLHSKDLTIRQIRPLLKEIPELDPDYIIRNNTAKKPGHTEPQQNTTQKMEGSKILYEDVIRRLHKLEIEVDELKKVCDETGRRSGPKRNAI